MGFRNFVVLGAALTAAHASAADAKTEALLAKMRSAYHSVKSAKFSVESASVGRLFKVQFSYEAPMKLRAEIAGLAGSPPNSRTTLMTDGKRMRAKTTGFARERTSPFAKDILERALVMANLESLSYFDWDQQLNTAPGKNMAKSILSIQPNQSWNGRTWIVLQESAPTDKLLCRYYIDPTTFLIWRTTQRRFGEKTDLVDARITSLELNVKLPPSTFAMPSTVPVGGPLIKT